MKILAAIFFFFAVAGPMIFLIIMAWMSMITILIEEGQIIYQDWKNYKRRNGGGTGAF